MEETSSGVILVIAHGEVNAARRRSKLKLVPATSFAALFKVKGIAILRGFVVKLVPDRPLDEEQSCLCSLCSVSFYVAGEADRF